MALPDFIVHELGDQLDRRPTLPVGTTGKVGDPAMFGRRPGYLLTDQDPNHGRATMKFRGSVKVMAHAYDASANNAIQPGDDVYYDPSPGAGNPNINKDATNGKFYGVAAGAVTAGNKTVLTVDLV